MDKRKKKRGGGVGEIKKEKREGQAEQSDEIQFNNSIPFLKCFLLPHYFSGVIRLGF